MSGKSAYLVPLIWFRKKKDRHLSDSNTRGQRPTANLLNVAGDPVNHSGKVTHSSHASYCSYYMSQEKLLLLGSSPSPYVLVIHGGAGTMSKEGSTPEQRADYKAALVEALQAVCIPYLLWTSGCVH